MRDMKQQKKGQKLRQNRRKVNKQPVDLRKLLRRLLHVCVFGLSAVLLVVGFTVLIQLLLASDLFRVESIQVEGNTLIERDVIVGLSDIKAGDMTFDLDLELIGRKIAENPWVRDAHVSRIFPRQVAIRTVERVPKAIINLDYLYYLDDRGEVFKVLSQGDSLDYPVITGFNRDALQENDPENTRQLKRIVALIENLEQREIFPLREVSEIHRDDSGGMTLFTRQAAVKVRLGRCDYEEKIDRLERIYPKLETRLSMLDYIDLNVDQRVIVRVERTATQARG